MKKSGGAYTVLRTSPTGQSIDVARLSALAQSAYAEKKMDVVLDLSSRLLDADPENVVALKMTARIHAQRGENHLAEPIWRRLCSTGPDKVEPALSLARIAYSRGDWDAMAEFADLAVRESDGRTDTLRLAITARIKAKRAEELPKMLLWLYDAEPDRFTTVLKMLSGPELAQAQATVLARLVARAPLDPALDSLVRDCRKSWDVGARRAKARMDDEARAAYLRAIWSYDPGACDAIAGLNALSRERLKFLRMAIKNGDDEATLQQGEAVAKFNPTAFEPWFAIARVSAATSPLRSAECFRICAEMKPDDVYLRFQQGRALVWADRLDEAILAFKIIVDGADRSVEPIAAAAQAEIDSLRPKVFRRSIEAARYGRLDDARTFYFTATGSLKPGGGGFPAAAHALFWTYVSAARAAIALRSVERSVSTIWKRTKTRSARLRRRLLANAANPAARPDAARS